MSIAMNSNIRVVSPQTMPEAEHISSTTATPSPHVTRRDSQLQPPLQLNQQELIRRVHHLRDLATKTKNLSLNNVLGKISLDKLSAGLSLSQAAETTWMLHRVAPESAEFDNSEVNTTLANVQSSFHDLLSSMLDRITGSSISGDMTQFRALKGSDLFARLEPYCAWKDSIREAGLWLYEKTSKSAPLMRCEAESDYGMRLSGVNFSSQDYLSLSSHEAIKDAAKQAIDEYGVHSAGSAALFGNTKFSSALEKEIAQFLKMDSIALFPTGWGAGYGVITALIRQQDHIVADHLIHSCLREGALNSTKNISFCPHLDNQAIAAKLKQIRSKDSSNAILVVSEALFSMDSDSPNLAELQDICHQYNARLLVDVAHDFGCLGQTGGGILETQGMIGKVDLIIGSFSKTFGSNGGFIASRSRALKEYLTSYSGPRTFSNALSPCKQHPCGKLFRSFNQMKELS